MLTRDERQALAARIRLGEIDPQSTHKDINRGWWRIDDGTGYILGVRVGTYRAGYFDMHGHSTPVRSDFTAILEWLES